MNVFTYMYYSKRAAFDESQFKISKTKYKDSLNSITIKLAEADYFH